MQLIHRTLSFLVVPAITACATFQPALDRDALIRTRQPTALRESEGLIFSVEEFASAAKSKRAFDADLAENGVLALLLRFDNGGDRQHTVRIDRIRATAGDQPLERLIAEQAADEAATREYVGKAAGWTLATGPFAIFLWPVTIAGSASHTYEVNKKVRRHFGGLELVDARLEPGEAAAGFVFFRLPEELRESRTAITVTADVERDDGSTIPFRLPLPLDAATSNKTESEASQN